jgi:hypothetical protein
LRRTYRERELEVAITAVLAEQQGDGSPAIPNNDKLLVAFFTILVLFVIGSHS